MKSTLGLLISITAGSIYFFNDWKTRKLRNKMLELNRHLTDLIIKNDLLPREQYYRTSELILEVYREKNAEDYRNNLKYILDLNYELLVEFDNSSLTDKKSFNLLNNMFQNFSIIEKDYMNKDAKRIKTFSVVVNTIIVLSLLTLLF